MSRYPTYGSSGPPPSGYEYSQQQQPQYGDDPARSRPGFPPSSVPGPPAGGPNFRWWIPENGIRRDVIQADIQRYLGPDALVKPGEGRDEDRGHRGYWIAAYRTLTKSMMDDLRADSYNFEKAGARGTPDPDGFGFGYGHIPNCECIGKYEDSTVHKSRQYHGSTDDQSRPTRADTASTSTQYTQGSAASTRSSVGQHSSASAQYPQGYGQAYGQTYEEPSSSRNHPQAQVPHTSPTNPNNPAYSLYATTGPPQATAQNYGGGYQQPTQSSRQHYDETRVPRSEQPAEPQHRNVPQPTYPNQSTHNQPSAQAPTGAPPGYYLASDGRYYPVQ